VHFDTQSLEAVTQCPSSAIYSPTKFKENENYSCIEHTSEYAGVKQRWLIVFSKAAYKSLSKN